MSKHKKYMRRCIELAKLGLGNTYPNPMVGSVIVYKKKIIGEGWHREAGQSHAEVNAIESVTDNSLLKKATIYVSLEPCSHFGKTPPCADRIISEGIPKVVIGSVDPNPKVAGNGIQKLIDAGCKVKSGILKEECDALNKRFFTYHQLKRPYIILKWAETKDGFIAPLKRDEQKPVWITNELSRQRVHKIRAEEQAILIGTNTALEDNPSLTVRDWEGTSPTKILIDRNLKVSEDFKIFRDEKPVLVFTSENKKDTNHSLNIKVDFERDLAPQICNSLFERGIQSVIVEGGAQTIQSFIDLDLWDEAFVFQGKGSFESGVARPKIEGTQISEEKIEDDLLIHYKKPAP